MSGARFAETSFDRLKFDLKLRRGRLSPIEILPYRGHGTAGTLFLKGRVLEGKGITRSSGDDTVWRNLRNMARRFESDEVPKARVRASLDTPGGRAQIVATTDKEGFFDVRFDLPAPLEGGTSWRPVELDLLWPKAPGQAEARATGHVLVPREASFGVISDIDDTVVRSSVTEISKMVRIALLNNAHTRLPFEGVASFYRALQRGVAGDTDGPQNPIFYVSSSPWNLYDLLEDFLDVHGVPAGPLFLKDWSPTTVRGHEEHKLGTIRRLLETYADLPFILIGDSGEKDPEIYRQVVREHPGRVRTIYIRDVTSDESRHRRAGHRRGGSRPRDGDAARARHRRRGPARVGGRA